MRAHADGAAQRREDGQGAFKIGFFTPGHDGQRAGFGADGAAGYGGIEVLHAHFLQLLCVFTCFTRLDGGHVDEHRSLGHGGSSAQREQHIAHDGAVFQQAHSHVYAAHGISGVVVNGDAVSSQRFGLGAGAIPGVNFVARLGQTASHGQAHHAGTQHGDFQAGRAGVACCFSGVRGGSGSRAHVS